MRHNLPKTMHFGKGISNICRPSPSSRLMVDMASFMWIPSESISPEAGALGVCGVSDPLLVT